MHKLFLPIRFAVAVSKCFDWLGLDLIMATFCDTPFFSRRYSFSTSVNSLPVRVSMAMSMSSLSLPNSLSRTQPPATRKTGTFSNLSCATDIKSAKSSFSFSVRVISPVTILDLSMTLLVVNACVFTV